MIENARELLKDAKWNESIVCYKQYLEKYPHDVEAYMELGLAYLLVEKREMFLEIYDKIKLIINQNSLDNLTSRAKSLWDYYCSIASKLTVVAAIGTTILVTNGLSGCSKNQEIPQTISTQNQDTKNQEDNNNQPQPQPQQQPQQPNNEQNIANPLKTADAGVQTIQTQQQPEQQQPQKQSQSQIQNNPQPQKKQTYSAHRYSSGIIIKGE